LNHLHISTPALHPYIYFQDDAFVLAMDFSGPNRCDEEWLCAAADGYVWSISSMLLYDPDFIHLSNGITTTKFEQSDHDPNEYRRHFGLPLLPERTGREWDAGGQNALLLAARNGHADVCEVLLKCRADVNKLDDYNQSALLLAAWEGKSLESVKVLLDYNATIKDSGADEWIK
jgi:hypothetical protein